MPWLYVDNVADIVARSRQGVRCGAGHCRRRSRCLMAASMKRRRSVEVFSVDSSTASALHVNTAQSDGLGG